MVAHYIQQSLFHIVNIEEHSTEFTRRVVRDVFGVHFLSDRYEQTYTWHFRDRKCYVDVELGGVEGPKNRQLIMALTQKLLSLDVNKDRHNGTAKISGLT